MNHGVDGDVRREVFDHSAKFFSLDEHHKMKLARKEYRGYTPPYAEILDPTSLPKGTFLFPFSFHFSTSTRRAHDS